jgi:putative oxidoreductase
MDFLGRFRPEAQAVLRIAAGLLFMQHGAQKLSGWLGGRGPVELFSQMGLAGVLEFFGGLLIVLGLLTMPVALILFLEMLAAYSIAHAPRGGAPVENGGELALLYAFVFLFFAAAGPGPFALDQLFGRNRDRG